MSFPSFETIKLIHFKSVLFVFAHEQLWKELDTSPKTGQGTSLRLFMRCGQTNLGLNPKNWPWINKDMQVRFLVYVRSLFPAYKVLLLKLDLLPASTAACGAGTAVRFVFQLNLSWLYSLRWKVRVMCLTAMGAGQSEKKIFQCNLGMNQ